MLVWAPVVIATALFYVRPDTPLLDRRRLLWSGAIVAGFSLSIVLWGVWVTSYDESWTWTRYGESLVTSPNQGLFERAGRVDLFLGYVTKYPLDTIFPGGWYPGLLLERSTFLTWFIPLNIAGLLIFGIVWPFRNGEPTAAGRVVSLSCLALFVCTIPAAWKNDSAQYERMNHVPLCLAVLAGFALGKTDTDWRRVARGLVAAVVVAVPLINSGAVLREARGQSWLARFDAMRISAPRRMTFVFAESEFGQGDFDKLASLHFALPNHLVLSPAGDIRHWPFTPVNHVLLDEYLSVPPDWRNLSPAAAALLESRRSSATLERLSR
jgi:hypothetical protein